MPACKVCGEEVDDLIAVKVDGRIKKLCENCADEANEQQEIAKQSESAVQQMMGYKGRR
jgi:ribosome-binding protein aMBF1 (putative translation factor)